MCEGMGVSLLGGLGMNVHILHPFNNIEQMIKVVPIHGCVRIEFVSLSVSCGRCCALFVRTLMDY